MRGRWWRSERKTGKRKEGEKGDRRRGEEVSGKELGKEIEADNMEERGATEMETREQAKESKEGEKR